MKNLLLAFPVTRHARVSFLLWTLLSGPAWAADVKSYIVQKGIQFVQSDAGAPAADSNNGAIFEATVKLTGTNLLTSASLTLPSGVNDALPQDASDEFKLKKKYDKQSGLDSNFPNGAYTLSLLPRHDPSQQISLNLTGNAYPNTPQLSNYVATQSIDAGAYFLFSWNPFVNGDTLDFVQLHIEDNQGNKVWETPDNGEPGALDGRATSVLLFPRTLNPGTTYQALLYFAKAITRDTTTYPGAVGFSGYYKRTKIAIQTAASQSQATVKLYGMTKSRHFLQSNAGAPVLQPSKTYNLDAFVGAGTADTVSSANLALPGGTVQSLALQSDNKTFDFSDDSTNQAAMDALYPSGNYAFKITSSQEGLKTASLNLSGDNYPSAPHLPSLPAAIDPARDLSVVWDPFPRGTSADFVQLHIEDTQGNKVYETPDFGKSGSLTGLALGQTVPANTLAPRKSYNARVVFQKNNILDTTSYPGALGVASYASRTTFQLTTMGSGTSPLELSASAIKSTGQFSIHLQGLPGQTVRIEASANLQSWGPISTNSLPATGQLDFLDPRPATLPSQFYRGSAAP